MNLDTEREHGRSMLHAPPPEMRKEISDVLRHRNSHKCRHDLVRGRTQGTGKS